MPAFTTVGVPDAWRSAGAMTITSLEGKTPLIGDVVVDALCWIGPGGPLRGA